MISLCQEALDYASFAVTERLNYVEIQSARWLILSEQGDLEAARAMEAKMLPLVSRTSRLKARLDAHESTRAIRDKSDYMPGWAQAKLDQYVHYERYWQASAELLREEAGGSLEA